VPLSCLFLGFAMARSFCSTPFLYSYYWSLEDFTLHGISTAHCFGGGIINPSAPWGATEVLNCGLEFELAPFFAVFLRCR